MGPLTNIIDLTFDVYKKKVMKAVMGLIIHIIIYFSIMNDT